MDGDGRQTLSVDLRGGAIPFAAKASGGLPLILQATLFYLEAAAVAATLAIVTGILAFTLLVQLIRFFGIEQSGGDTLNIVLWGLVAVAGLATFILVFIFYFRLLAKPIAGRIICALGSLIWALPAGLAAPMLLHRIIPRYSVLGTWIVFLGVAAVLYWLKRQIVRT
jgi:hypothetical protein